MTNQDKARRVAEWCEPCPQYEPTNNPEISGGGYWVAKYSGIWKPRYKYDDLNDCAEFERLVKGRGVLSIYIVELAQVTGHDSLQYMDSIEDLLLATPAQRVDAIWVVIKETQGAAVCGEGD